MIHPYGMTLYQLGESLAQLRCLLEKLAAKLGPKGIYPNIPSAETHSRLLAALKGQQIVAMFPSVTPQMERFAAAFGSGGMTLEEAEFQRRALHERIIDDLKTRYLYWLEPRHHGYYANKALFGQAVNEKFPSAIDDIEAAGNCIALGQGTASVLHLMRAVEVGLRVLGSMLEIPYAPSWESYLKQIADRIAAKHKTKGVDWRRDEKFFRDVSGDLLTVKQAWRNPTMHVDRKYSPDEAEEILRAVRAFMQRIEPRVKPPKRKASAPK